ncbi:MAG: histidine phosphatase family protein, partial [Sciscionella sp.]
WVPRARNADADALANEAMDARASTYDALTDDLEAEVPDAPPVAPAWNPPAGDATRLLLLRHGQTALSVDRRFSGRGNPSLTEVGRRQAAEAANRLVHSGIDVIVSSPLARAQETAAVVAGALGLPVTFVDELRECDFGEWDGLTIDEVSARWPDELADWLASFGVRPPGGESVSEVRQRVEPALDGLRERFPAQKVLVVTHVTPIKCAVRYALGGPMSMLNRLLLAPGSLTTLAWYDSGASALWGFNVHP